MKRKSNNYLDELKCNVYRKGRTIYFFDELSNGSVCEAIKLIQELEEESVKKPIQLIINSDGGSIYDGFALYDKLRNLQCHLSVIGTGVIASMAVVVYLAGEDRYLTENTRLMTHQGETEIEGRTIDIQVEAQEMKIIEENCASIIAERTGQSLNKVKNEIKIADRWISAEQAVDEGYAHEIIRNKRTRRRRKKK